MEDAKQALACFCFFLCDKCWRWLPALVVKHRGLAPIDGKWSISSRSHQPEVTDQLQLGHSICAKFFGYIIPAESFHFWHFELADLVNAQFSIYRKLLPHKDSQNTCFTCHLFLTLINEAQFAYTSCLHCHTDLESSANFCESIRQFRRSGIRPDFIVVDVVLVPYPPYLSEKVFIFTQLTLSQKPHRIGASLHFNRVKKGWVA